MAITRLTDLITVFDSKWTYGDVKFGYEPEVNQEHDTKYPLMLVEPPSSIIPEIYNGREEYTFEINFYNLYSQAAQSVVLLQKRWDNLQDLANEWLDMVLKNYQDSTVEVYLQDESVEIERVKEVANDRLVQIKLTFTMSGFTKCFTPVSVYPSDLSSLGLWLSADSNTTFDIATKKVSAWNDRDGVTNSNVTQATEVSKPLRYGYDGTNDKTYLSFDGTNDFFTSVGNSPVSADFTIFQVSKAAAVDGVIFGYVRGSTTLETGYTDAGQFYGKVYDGEYTLEKATTGGSKVGSSNIGIIIKDSKTIKFEYYDSTSSLNGQATDSSFDASIAFNANNFTIGNFQNARYFNGELSELIIFKRVLTTAEIADIKGYLNLKYKIY